MDVLDGYDVAFRTMDEYTDQCTRMVDFGTDQAVRKVWQVCADTVRRYWSYGDWYGVGTERFRENARGLDAVLEVYYDVFRSLGANLSIGKDRIGDTVWTCRVSLSYEGRGVGVIKTNEELFERG